MPFDMCYTVKHIDYSVLIFNNRDMAQKKLVLKLRNIYQPIPWAILYLMQLNGPSHANKWVGLLPFWGIIFYSTQLPTNKQFLKMGKIQNVRQRNTSFSLKVLGYSEVIETVRFVYYMTRHPRQIIVNN